MGSHNSIFPEKDYALYLYSFKKTDAKNKQGNTKIWCYSLLNNNKTCIISIRKTLDWYLRSNVIVDHGWEAIWWKRSNRFNINLRAEYSCNRSCQRWKSYQTMLHAYCTFIWSVWLFLCRMAQNAIEVYHDEIKMGDN